MKGLYLWKADLRGLISWADFALFEMTNAMIWLPRLDSAFLFSLVKQARIKADFRVKPSDKKTLETSLCVGCDLQDWRRTQSPLNDLPFNNKSASFGSGKAVSNGIQNLMWIQHQNAFNSTESLVSSVGSI